MSRYDGQCPKCGEWVDSLKVHMKEKHPEPKTKTLYFLQEVSFFQSPQVIGPFDSQHDAEQVGRQFYPNSPFNVSPVEVKL